MNTPKAPMSQVSHTESTNMVLTQAQKTRAFKEGWTLKPLAVYKSVN